MNVFNKPKLTVAVHNGVFHPDDALSVAILETVLEPDEINVIRSRSYDDIKKADFILDVGNKDVCIFNDDGDIIQVWLDHHQTNNTELDFYVNGVQKAACGKIFELLWDLGYVQKRFRITKDSEELVKEYIMTDIFYSVESQDNGQKIENLKLKSNKFSFVTALNPPFNKMDDETLLEKFIISVHMSKEVFVSIVESCIADANSIFRVESLLRNNDRDNILYMDTYLPWFKPVIEYNKECDKNGESNKKILAVVFRSVDKNFMVQVTPTQDGGRNILFPKEWGGKRNKDLVEASGIKDAIFCHAGLWLAAWRNKKSAIEAAEKAIEQYFQTNKER